MQLVKIMNLYLNVERDLQKICLSFEPVGRDCIMTYAKDFFLFLWKKETVGFQGRLQVLLLRAASTSVLVLGPEGVLVL